MDAANSASSTHLTDLKSLTHDVLYVRSLASSELYAYSRYPRKRTVPRSFRAPFTQIRSTCLSFTPNRKAHVFSCSDSSILPEDLASQSVRLKEEQLRREEEKVRIRFGTLFEPNLSLSL